jgi:hypothetical protein
MARGIAILRPLETHCRFAQAMQLSGLHPSELTLVKDKAAACWRMAPRGSLPTCSLQNSSVNLSDSRMEFRVHATLSAYTNAEKTLAKYGVVCLLGTKNYLGQSTINHLPLRELCHVHHHFQLCRSLTCDFQRRNIRRGDWPDNLALQSLGEAWRWRDGRSL